MRRMIFGTGSGRCGTWSLYTLLKQQLNTLSAHEGVPLPWEQDLTIFWRSIFRLQIHPETLAGDKHLILANTSFVWINYIGEIMSHFLFPKVICLKRDRQEVIESFMNYNESNPWVDPESEHFDGHGKSSSLFPKYDLPKDEAIGAYWDEFYNIADYWADKFPESFKIFPTDALNHKSTVLDMLNFMEIPEKNQNVHVGIRFNLRDKPKGDIARKVKLEDGVLNLAGAACQ